jgi:hypothetical protein
VTREHCIETNPTNKAAIFAAWNAKCDELSDRITFREPFAAPSSAIKAPPDVQQRPRRQRKPRPATIINQIENDTGKTVTSVTITPGGDITLTFGSEPSANSEANPWDKVLPDAANKKRLA